MKIFFSAGEASGDLHASHVIRQLKTLSPECEIRFLGGDLMTEAAGVAPEIHYSEMAFMGFGDVIAHLPQVLGNLSKAKKALRDFMPDMLVLVDYPGFNLRLASYAKSLGIKVDYFIPPKIWAWKEYRLRDMRKYIDRIFSILPFEKEWYAERGVDVEYVGNPSVEELRQALDGLPSRPDFPGIDHSRPVLALVPGSRRGEIRDNLPVMDAAARRMGNVNVLVAAAPSVPADYYRQYTSFPLVEGATLRLMASADAALVTSGTASLECAIARTPQIVCYRAVGWKWAHDLFSHILKIPYVSLPNLIHGPIDRLNRSEVNREASRTGVRGCVVPELLVHNCNADNIIRLLEPLMHDSPERTAQLRGYDEMMKRLRVATPTAETVARRLLDR